MNPEVRTILRFHEANARTKIDEPPEISVKSDGGRYHQPLWYHPLFYF